MIDHVTWGTPTCGIFISRPYDVEHAHKLLAEPQPSRPADTDPRSSRLRESQRLFTQRFSTHRVCRKRGRDTAAGRAHRPRARGDHESCQRTGGPRPRHDYERARRGQDHRAARRAGATRIRRQARNAATDPGRCCAARTAFALGGVFRLAIDQATPD